MFKISKVDALKGAIDLAIGLGTYTIVKQVVKANLPGKMGIITKVCVFLGTMALTGLISDKVCENANSTIDDVVECGGVIKKAVDIIKEHQK